MKNALEIADGIKIILEYAINPEVYSSNADGLVSATHLIIEGVYPDVMETEDSAKLKELKWFWNNENTVWMHSLHIAHN